MKVELRHLSFLCSDLDMGNVCPACPKVNNLWMHVYTICEGVIFSSCSKCTQYDNNIYSTTVEVWQYGAVYGCTLWFASEEVFWTKL